jgi:hypothetical protein
MAGAAAMSQPEAMGVADKKVVFDLMEDLRAAWERILNDYAEGKSSAGHLQTERGGVRYVDGWMACHNFFKLALDHLVSEAGLTGEAAAILYLGAGETFQMAMRARAEEMRTGRRAGADNPHKETP